MTSKRPSKPENLALAAALRAAREAADLTQKDVAQAMKVSQQSVQYWESAVAAPKRQKLHLLAKYLRCPGLLLETPIGPEDGLQEAGRPAPVGRMPVVGTAQMGDDGFYQDTEHPPGFGDGWVMASSADVNAFALRVRGDSMHPAIRHGWFVIVEPNRRCVTGEFVQIALIDGRKMVKELVIERADEIVVESVNGNHRRTIARADILHMYKVGAVIPQSSYIPG